MAHAVPHHFHQVPAPPFSTEELLRRADEVIQYARDVVEQYRLILGKLQYSSQVTLSFDQWARLAENGDRASIAPADSG